MSVSITASYKLFLSSADMKTITKTTKPAGKQCPTMFVPERYYARAKTLTHRRLTPPRGRGQSKLTLPSRDGQSPVERVGRRWTWQLTRCMSNGTWHYKNAVEPPRGALTTVPRPLWWRGWLETPIEAHPRLGQRSNRSGRLR